MPRCLRRTRSRRWLRSCGGTSRRGASRIRAEHLKGWLAAAKRGGLAEEKGEEKMEAEEEGGELWGEVVEINQTEFREGKLEE